MKRILILLAGLGTLVLAAAQQSASYDPQAAERERVRIEAERRQALERYGQEEADCYQRFAVNDCLSEMRKRRRVTLEELRRQEIILGDERRAAASTREPRPASRIRIRFILETAVGRARVGRHGVDWEGETTQRATARKEEQRAQRTPGRLNRVRSALTQQMSVCVAARVNIHGVSSGKQAVNCCF